MEGVERGGRMEQVCGGKCGCERAERPGAMRFLIGSGVWMLACGGWVVARTRPRWFPLWLAALTTWFTVCKYLICTRCEYYGEACDFYQLGRLAARMFERQPGRTLDAAGKAAEGASVAVLQLLPVAAAARNRRRLLFFLAALLLNQGTQLAVCCRNCVRESTDPWKAQTCPSYRLAAKLFS